MKNSKIEPFSLISIKKFSEFSGVKQSTLRYYDKIGLLSPQIRGENNYRYYTPIQCVTLNFISVLSDLGIPLATIKKISDSRTPERILELLTQQESKLDYQLRELQKTYSIIHTFRNNILTGLSIQESDITVQKFEETRIAFGVPTDFKNDETYYRTFTKFCNSAEQFGIDLRYPIGGYYDNIDSFLKSPGHPDRFFSLDPTGASKRPAGQYLVTYNRGYYGEFDDVPKKITEYAQEHQLTFSGPLYAIYLLDEISIADYNKYLVQLTIGVKKPKSAHKE